MTIDPCSTCGELRLGPHHKCPPKFWVCLLTDYEGATENDWWEKVHASDAMTAAEKFAPLYSDYGTAYVYVAVVEDLSAPEDAKFYRIEVAYTPCYTGHRLHSQEHAVADHKTTLGFPP